MKHDNLRLTLFFIGVLLISGLILQRLFVLSVIKHELYYQIAQAQNENINNVSSRGNIYMSDGKTELSIVATNKKFPLAYIVPLDAGRDKINKEELIDNLSSILEIDKEFIREKIESKKSGTRVVARRITEDQIEAINDLDIQGVGVSYEVDRFYPAGELSSNVIGFLGYNVDGDRAGQYGIEGYYNDDLSNQSRNIILTIDVNIQKVIEDKLDSLMKKWEAEQGTIIVQDPETGKILAMADRPSFDPNNYRDFKPNLFLSDSI